MPQMVRAQLDYYAVLEVMPAADTGEINAAFRRLAWRYHPDRNPAPGATLQFQDINEAHQVLSDPVRRADYDARWHPRGNHSHAGAHAAHHPNRRWRRNRHLRTVLVGMFALLFVSSAWAVIFTAMRVAHSSGPGSFDFAGTSMLGGESASCSFTMEMFPVTYRDPKGHVQTAWETEVHNCYGGGTRFVNLPQLGSTSGPRFLNDPQAR